MTFQNQSQEKNTIRNAEAAASGEKGVQFLFIRGLLLVLAKVSGGGLSIRQ